MKLGDHLKAVKKTPEWFGPRIGVDPKTVRKYIDGSRRPRWDILPAIERETGGQVTANDFVKPVTRAERRKRKSASEPESAPEREVA